MNKKLIVLLIAAITIVSCENKESQQQQKDLSRPDYSHVDSLVINTITSVNRDNFYENNWRSERARFLTDSLKAFIDSLEDCGSLSAFGADAFRGNLYRYVGEDDEAAVYFRRALKHDGAADRRQWYYNFSGNELANLLYGQQNYEGFLRVAVPLLASMDSLDNGIYDQKINLYSQLACCYVKLGQSAKAKEVAQKAREYCWQVLAVDSSVRIHQVFINSFACIKDAYVRVKDWDEVRSWMAINDSVGKLFYRRHPDAQVWPIYMAYTHLDLAIKLWSLGDKDSAAVEFDQFRNTEYFYTATGILQANDYLMNAERWDDAANNYQYFDYIITKPDLEEIYSYYFPKFRANYNAGRRDSALYTANQIAALFDSAYVAQKKNQMAEMATIYDTQGKEMQIAHQQAELSQQRLWGTGIAMVLLTAFFIIYTLYRRRAQKRLATAHKQLETAHTELQTAYDQLEETTAAKERIESELRIARDIQMSMVPGVFPERDGLDMYAEMTPAKEVGGDLYGYVMQGDQLYFCVGDVSGKGVPASLFMAQSARLFRTLATEGMEPADIATRMNSELAEGNDRNMFVTMFIGLLHLDTGRLDYCNCGHNAPVIDDHFLAMKHVNQMIGVLEGAPFFGETIDDIRGSQLLIYTDGLNEAENQQKEQFGNDRILKIMADAQSLTSHEIVNKLEDAVEQHRISTNPTAAVQPEPSDDLTLMCLKLTATKNEKQ